MAGLLDPFTVKGLTLKNRIVMAPMGTQMATDTGVVTDRHLRHYTARAHANVGLVMVEYTYVRKAGRLRNTQLGVSDDSHIPGLRRLADAIRTAGASCGLQLDHVGPKARTEALSFLTEAVRAGWAGQPVPTLIRTP